MVVSLVVLTRDALCPVRGLEWGCWKTLGQEGDWWWRIGMLLALMGGGVGVPVGQAQSDSSHADLEPRTVEVEYELYASNKTPQEARRQAVDRAKAEAVRQAIGTQVQAEQRSSTIETGEDVVSRFSQVVRTGASGRVVSSEVLEEQRPERNGEVFQYVRIRATVQPATGRADPGFEVDVSLADEDQTFVARSALEESDEVIAELDVTKDAYLTLFSVTPDTLRVIWPNALSRDTFVPAETTVEFPSPSLRAGGLHLRVSVPEGQDRLTERIVAVATKQKILFREIPEYQVEEGQLTAAQASIEALNRWLVDIPLGQRAVASATYEVVRAGER